MKCLSFIGAGQLRETRYRYHDQVCQTAIVQEAIARFFPVDEMVFFVTSRAEEVNFQQALSRCPGAKKVSVPDGRSETELWEIFSLVADEVREGDTIIFDITHGLRSLPFIALLSAAYLQEVKGAKLAGMVYGAFEAGNGEETPLFDLSGFLQIFDWMAGVRSFLNHTDARHIRTLIQKIAAQEHQASGGAAGPTRIGSFATRLEGFTSAVRLSRPVEGIEYAQSILRSLPDAKEEIGTYTPALKPLIGKINSIERFSAATPDNRHGPCQDHIRKQLELIRFQVEQGLYLQAVTLAREWMVTVLICAKGDGKDWLSPGIRPKAERTLGGAVKKMKGEWYDKAEYSDWFESRENWKECSRIWDRIAGLRNDIAHCGMNEQEQKAGKLEARVRNLPKDLEAFIGYLLPGAQE